MIAAAHLVGNRPTYRMRPGERLTAIDTNTARVPGFNLLRSRNGQYFLVIQRDGNLVEYRTSTGLAIWSTGSTFGDATSPFAIVFLSAQRDGNVVVYGPAGPIWSSGTAGTTPDQLVLQDDGNLVLYPPGGGQAIWSNHATS